MELGLESACADHASRPDRALVDMRIQYVLEHAIEEAAHDFRTKAAGGIVLNVHGRGLALASMPDYEPNMSPAGAGRFHPQPDDARRL